MGSEPVLKKKKLSSKLLAILFSIALCVAILFILELSARVVYRAKNGVWPQSLASYVESAKRQSQELFELHSVLPFKIRPGAASRYMLTDYKINEAGYRGPELRSETPLRILVVGGSKTFDVCVSDNESMWTRRLEEHLQDYFPGCEVVNAGAPIYCMMDNAVRYMLYDYALKADVVLIHQAGNDLIPFYDRNLESLFEKDYWFYKGDIERKFASFHGAAVQNLNPGFLPGLFQRSVLLAGGYSARIPITAEYWTRNLTPLRRINQFFSPRLQRKLPALFSSFLGMIRASGGIPVFVTEAYATDTGVSRKYLAAVSLLCDAYIRICKSKDAPYIDMRQGADFTSGYFGDHIHFNDEGAEVFGRLLSERLAEVPEIVSVYQKNSESKPRKMPDFIPESISDF